MTLRLTVQRLIQKVTIVSLVFALFLAKTAHAKNLTADDLRAMQTKMKAYDTLAVDFVQTKSTGLRPGKGSVRQGHAFFEKPNLFKWMLETPNKEYKIYDGKALYDYDPDSNSATKYSPTGPKHYELREMIDLVLNFDSLLKRYDLKKAEEKAGSINIILTPKAKGDVTEVELTLQPKEAFISFLKMTFSNKMTLAHEFKNPSHKPIPEASFQLPKGVKITDSN